MRAPVEAELLATNPLEVCHCLYNKISEMLGILKKIKEITLSCGR